MNLLLVNPHKNISNIIETLSVTPSWKDGWQNNYKSKYVSVANRYKSKLRII